mmetsp:Transcript_3147/g.13127  ORF Transcript_3147/g.13127 Transcript_3147/m.13127 type:complete len:314 (+) Transcript_3147:4668-5609(+)
MSVQKDAEDASVENPSSSSSPGLPPRPPPFGLRRAGCSSGSATTESGSTSLPSMPTSSSSTTTETAGAAHQATPSNPTMPPPRPPPGRTPDADACCMDMPPPFSTSLSDPSEPDPSEPSSSSSPSPSKSPRFPFFFRRGISGSSTCMIISLNQPGLVVAWHTCVLACARPQRTTANGSDEPCASAAGRSFAWYTCTVSIYDAVGRGSISAGGSEAAWRIARTSAFRRSASARFSEFALAAFSGSSSSSSPSSSLAAAAASFSSAATSAGDIVFASRFALGEPCSIMRSSTRPTGLTCSARLDSPRLCPPMASA